MTIKEAEIILEELKKPKWKKARDRMRNKQQWEQMSALKVIREYGDPRQWDKN